MPSCVPSGFFIVIPCVVLTTVLGNPGRQHHRYFSVCCFTQFLATVLILSWLHGYLQSFDHFSCVHTYGIPEFQPPSVDAVSGGDGEGGPELARVVRGGTPGEFNLYIFAMSWKAEW